MASTTEKLDTLNTLYHDPNSNLYLVRDSAKIYKLAKEQSKLSDLTYDDVTRFKSLVESISRSKAEKRLKGNARRYSYRKYKLFSHSIITGTFPFTHHLFSICTTHLYKKIYPSVRPSVHPSTPRPIDQSNFFHNKN
jgi:hypothetical protein